MEHHVLIAEDEANIALALEFIMTQKGYKVSLAETGEDALRIAIETKPDLILLDVMLPERDGYDICQTLRMDPDMGATKIILLTAKGGKNEREKGLALGADEFIPKPFSTTDLANRVQELLAS